MADLAASAIGGQSSPRVVYVLDDDALVRNGILQLLNNGGYQPLGFSAPAQMLDKVKQAPPEVIVLDLALGQSDAIDVMRQLADCKFEGKILLVSGRDEAMLGEVQRIGERQGLAMLPALQKPFHSTDLKSRLSAQVKVAERSPIRGPINNTSVDVVEAIAAGWLELWYQPKIDLRSFLVCGAEALLRARHPAHGILAPAAIVPPAGSPLHQPLAKFVIQRAIMDWRSFADHGMSLKLAINLPVSVINAPDFMSALREQLPTDPRYPGLGIEITEDEAITDPDWISQISTQLKLYDVRISIDDFGTAHSSLSRLLELPAMELKLDRRFVSNCASDRLKSALCQTVVDLAHRVGSQVCAEGVETIEDLEAIIGMGCDTAQGYLFAKPMPAETFAASIIARPMQFAERFAHLQRSSESVSRGC
jgi:EAL domain-containing protein (putative c-di-GMP-specific phosphodiesterase class I)/FixJ family two-component response regulator